MLLLVGAVVVAVLTVVLVVTRRRNGCYGLPGPAGYPLIGSALSLDLENWLAYSLEWCKRTNFEPWGFFLGSQANVATMDPRDVEFMLSSHFDAFHKGEDVHNAFFELLGDGIFAVDGEQWRQHRKAASHLFSSGKLKAFQDQVFAKIANVLAQHLRDRAQAGDVVDLQDIFYALTFDSFVELAFGKSFKTLDLVLQTGEKAEFLAAFDVATQVTGQRMMQIPVAWKARRALGLGEEGDFAKRIGLIVRHADELIQDALEISDDDLVDRGDLLGVYIVYARKNKADEMLTKSYLRDMTLNFLLAGRDTTAQLLTAIFRMLDHHHAVRDKLEAEIDSVGDALTYDAIKKMPYLDAVVKEALRLFPSVPVELKIAARDVQLPSGTAIKENDIVAYHILGIQRKPSLWGDDAEEFRPERWIEKTAPAFKVEARKFQFVYPAFNAGPRKCLGESMALLEAKTVVAHLIQARVRFALVNRDTDDFNSWRDMVMSPVTSIKNGLKGTISLR